MMATTVDKARPLPATVRRAAETFMQPTDAILYRRPFTIKQSAADGNVRTKRMTGANNVVVPTSQNAYPIVSYEGFWNDSGNVVQVPVGWSYGMMVGLQPTASGSVGFMHRTRGGNNSFGVLAPETLSGAVIATVSASSEAAANTVIIECNIPSTQLPGMGRITITVQGFGGSVIALWHAGNVRYQIANQTAFGNFMRASVGSTIGITLVAAA
jgi:hypothetical protein